MRVQKIPARMVNDAAATEEVTHVDDACRDGRAERGTGQAKEINQKGGRGSAFLVGKGGGGKQPGCC